MEAFVLNILGTHPMHMELVHILNLDRPILIQWCLTFLQINPPTSQYEIVGQVGGFIYKKSEAPLNGYWTIQI
jgi:hypothetical protein